MPLKKLLKNSHILLFKNITNIFCILEKQLNCLVDRPPPPMANTSTIIAPEHRKWNMNIEQISEFVFPKVFIFFYGLK